MWLSRKKATLRYKFFNRASKLKDLLEKKNRTKQFPTIAIKRTKRIGRK
jgi:hypothetical protein